MLALLLGVRGRVTREVDRERAHRSLLVVRSSHPWMPLDRPFRHMNVSVVGSLNFPICALLLPVCLLLLTLPDSPVPLFCRPTRSSPSWEPSSSLQVVSLSDARHQGVDMVLQQSCRGGS